MQSAPLFSGHAVHDSLPLEVLYVPVAHAVHAFPVKHAVSVKSTPCSMVLVISVVAVWLRYSSTTKAPAMSPLKLKSVETGCTPMLIPVNVLSLQIGDTFTSTPKPFIVNKILLVDTE
jgi:hypothetical protein